MESDDIYPEALFDYLLQQAENSLFKLIPGTNFLPNEIHFRKVIPDRYFCDDLGNYYVLDLKLAIYSEACSQVDLARTATAHILVTSKIDDIPTPKYISALKLVKGEFTKLNYQNMNNSFNFRWGNQG